MTIVDLSTITDILDTYGLDHDMLEGLPSRPTTKAIYGRAGEALQLLHAYQHLLQTKQAQSVVIVHGESGSGKTTLVNTLRESVFDSKGYFVGGKYFDSNAAVQEPYSAIMAAFSDLCDLVVQSNDFDEERREDIANMLGPDAQLLVTSISNLTRLVGDVKEVEMAPSFAKFKVACKTFLRAVASEKHPVVIFLDDIQWADQGSIQLIQNLLQDSELNNVLLVLAYRDEDAVQVETSTLAHAHDRTDIALSNLGEGDVHLMVTSILGSTTTQIRQLSDLVTKRTFGNPLHVSMFIDAATQEELLVHNSANNSWSFNVDDIREKFMVAENLADMLMRKVERLPDANKKVLKMASLLGYRFDQSILLQVACTEIQGGPNVDDTLEFPSASAAMERDLVVLMLSDAEKEGFLEKTGYGYQFTHDKVQSSFLSLIQESEEAQLHLLFGKEYLVHVDDDKSNFYKATVHLNNAPGFLYDNAQPARLGRLNFEAAKYCADISAFDKAADMLQSGLNALSLEEGLSKERSSLTSEMMLALARTQLIVGDLKACKETTREALCQKNTASFNAQLFLVDVEVRMAGNEIDGAIITATRALNALGVKMPRRVMSVHVMAKLARVKFMLRHKTDEDILNLPLADSTLVEDTVKLLTHLCCCCLVSVRSDAAVFTALLATELTLKHGMSQFSSCAFAIYGVAEVSLGNIDRAYRFGALALGMLNRIESKGADCHTAAFTLTQLSFQRERLDNIVIPLSRAANSGFEYGDIPYSTYCTAHCYAMQIHMGTNLQSLEASMRVSYRRVSDLGQDTLLMWLQPTLQYTLNMQSNDGSWEDIALFSGEAMNEEGYCRLSTETNRLLHILLLLLWKAKVAVDFGQYELAASTLAKCKAYGSGAICLSYLSLPYYLDQARTSFGLYELSGHRQHLRDGRKYTQLLEQMKGLGCPSAAPLHAFLVAQASSVGNKRVNEPDIRAAYDNGIVCLVDVKNYYLEGLLNEKAGFEFTRRRLSVEDAERYFNRALHVYLNECGATAKYNQLKKRMAIALKGLKRVQSDGPYGKCISFPSPVHL